MNPEAFSLPIIMGLSISQIWSILSPFLAAILGGYLVLYFDRKKAKKNHRLKLEYEGEIAARIVRRDSLLRAYEWIDAAMPDRLTFLELDAEEAFERTKLAGQGMALVKLFGSERLCASVDRYVEMLNGECEFDSSEFMNDFRDELRDFYALEKTESRYRWVDFTKKKARDDSKSLDE